METTIAKNEVLSKPWFTPQGIKIASFILMFALVVGGVVVANQVYESRRNQQLWEEFQTIESVLVPELKNWQEKKIYPYPLNTQSDNLEKLKQFVSKTKPKPAGQASALLLGEILMGAQSFAEAETVLSGWPLKGQILSLLIHYQKSIALIEQKKWAEAKNLLEQVKSADEKKILLPEIQLLLGIVYYNLNQFDKASAEWESLKLSDVAQNSPLKQKAIQYLMLVKAQQQTSHESP